MKVYRVSQNEYLCEQIPLVNNGKFTLTRVIIIDETESYVVYAQQTDNIVYALQGETIAKIVAEEYINASNILRKMIKKGEI